MPSHPSSKLKHVIFLSTRHRFALVGTNLGNDTQVLKMGMVSSYRGNCWYTVNLNINPHDLKSTNPWFFWMFFQPWKSGCSFCGKISMAFFHGVSWRIGFPHLVSTGKDPGPGAYQFGGKQLFEKSVGIRLCLIFLLQNFLIGYPTCFRIPIQLSFNEVEK